VDFSSLRYFTEVVRQQNVTKAAQRLGIAQPALTRRLHILEEELGTSLLVRHRRGVRPTDAGLKVFERAQLLLRLADEMQGDVLSQTTEPIGQIRFGYPPSLGNLFLTRLIADFLRKFPRVSLQLDEHFSPVVRDELLSGRIDIGIMTCEAEHPDLQLVPLFAEGLWLMGRADIWPFKSARSLLPSHITGQPILIASFLRTVVEKQEAENNFHLQVRMEADALTTLRESVRAGIGFMLGPPSGVSQQLDSGEFVGAPVRGLNVTRGLFRRRDRPLTRALQEFETMILAQTAELVKKRPTMFKALPRTER
jgi:LysR family transcriptional regulator, nitrogen assimilation regulatory protein